MTKEQELREALKPVGHTVGLDDFGNDVTIERSDIEINEIITISKQYCHLKGEQELHDERFAAGMHISYPDLLDILDRANFKPTEDWDE